MADIAICDANVQEGVDVLQDLVNELKPADKEQRNKVPDPRARGRPERRLTRMCVDCSGSRSWRRSERR